MATRYNYTGGIVTDGLVLHLDAAKRDSYPGSGTTWYDLSGNGNDGTLTNGPTYSGVAKDAAVEFDYSNDYVSFPDLPSSTVYSVSCWFTAASGNWNGALFGFGTGASPNTQNVYLFGEWENGCTSPSGGSFGYNTWNCDSYGFGNASATLKGTGFHHVVATFNHQDVASNQIWLNGVQQTITQQVGSTQFNANLNNRFKLSSNGWHTSNQLWNGDISQVQIYNKELTASEITQNYNTLKGRYGL